MNSITKENHVDSHSYSKNESLESLLIKISHYGTLALYLQKSGWHCSVDVNVTKAGVRFTVGSEFELKTPIEAANQCLDRVQEAIKSKYS